jgi:SAM-dependent methyltransferase
VGISYSSAAILAKAKHNNVCFDNILTIGHQQLYLSQKQISQLAMRYGLNIDTSAVLREEYVDTFFEMFLGAKIVMSLDYSDYQDSDIIHDMNYPIDPSYHEKFDVVIDGGSLEHIFNFPVAVGNCMNMVKNGGSVFIFTAANNHTGHGFYQFSPELFFRIFQPENGFEICDVILEKHTFPGAELSPKTKCFSVIDPALLKRRVGLVSKSPVMIMIHAKRIEIKPVFATYPIQSDNMSIYDNNSSSAPDQRINTSILTLMKGVARKFVNRLPLRAQNYIEGKRQLLRYSFSNKRFYKRWYPF